MTYPQLQFSLIVSVSSLTYYFMSYETRNCFLIILFVWSVRVIMGYIVKNILSYIGVDEINNRIYKFLRLYKGPFLLFPLFSIFSHYFLDNNQLSLLIAILIASILFHLATQICAELEFKSKGISNRKKDIKEDV